MAWLAFLNVPSLQTIRFCMISRRSTKLVPSGITPICVGYQRSQRCLYTHILPDSQYCDGLRGPLILYDPEDPHKNLYDVDDGTPLFLL